MKSDILVIGGGVIGLSMAKHLSKRASVTLIEKNHCGAHTSGRNSGVIHAGIYYTPGSAKAKYSVLGNKALSNFCLEKGVGFNNLGKIISPANDVQVPKIRQLYERALQNGAKVELIDYHQAKEIEPRIRKQELYLWSPLTSIADNKGVIKALKQECTENNVQILENCQYLSKVSQSQNSTVVNTSKGKIEARFVVNCAGLYTDKIAQDFGFGKDYQILPIVGLYVKAREGIRGFNTLVYPVPIGENQFLGVHTTNQVNGGFTLGPTATPALWREQYSFTHNFKSQELLETLYRYTKCVVSSNRGIYLKILKEELRKYFKKNIVSDCDQLVEELKTEDFLEWGPPGIFPQLVDKKTCSLIQDFKIERDEHSLHFLNIVSPGWTSALAFTQDVADSIL